jgi:hypothetical protein
MPNSRAHRGKQLRISSEDKQIGQTNANFTVNLGNSAFVQDVKAVVVKSISFKHVFPNIFEGNQTFKFNYNLVDYEVKVPEGWYDASSLATVLTDLITAAIPGIVTVDLVVSPPGAPASENSYFQFTTDVNDLVLLPKSDGNALADVIGISEKIIITGALGSSRVQYLPDLGGLSVIYLCSNVIAGANSVASSNNGEVVPVVTEIPVNAPFGGEIVYRSLDHELDTILFQNPKNLNSVDLTLCTRSGETLDLLQNNLTCQFRLIPVGAYAVA